MRKVLVIILLLSSYVSYSQSGNSLNILFTTNHAINLSEPKMARGLGFDFGLGYGRHLKSNFF